ncbi:hypothetical protein LEMLEM_LOCUS4906, partial [Lemmus lemmus]
MFYFYFCLSLTHACKLEWGNGGYLPSPLICSVYKPMLYRSKIAADFHYIVCLSVIPLRRILTLLQPSPLFSRGIQSPRGTVRGRWRPNRDLKDRARLCLFPQNVESPIRIPDPVIRPALKASADATAKKAETTESEDGEELTEAFADTTGDTNLDDEMYSPPYRIRTCV